MSCDLFSLDVWVSILIGDFVWLLIVRNGFPVFARSLCLWAVDRLRFSHLYLLAGLQPKNKKMKKKTSSKKKKGGKK